MDGEVQVALLYDVYKRGSITLNEYPDPLLLRRERMKLFKNIANPREIRLKLGMNQQEFWSKVGVTQSGGSRYESGREMPKAVRELVRLVYIEHIDLSKVKQDDLLIASMLKVQDPDLYKSLKKSVKQLRK